MISHAKSFLFIAKSSLHPKDNIFIVLYFLKWHLSIRNFKAALFYCV
ncbi:hypothetical protein ELI_0612 [Eubacterium callanderi]|uniref:Uncharacterized protein n=1 Tax=Eubacterium callanderi TaxID=53442 RepID=E3GIZ3_9FIRM|nr:hypothetical protein ELI_0612 [Eubacterium callanderi]